MTRGIWRAWPLLAGVALCAVGCTFPKWALHLKRQPDRASTAAADSAAADARPQDPAAPRSPTDLLAAARQATRHWLPHERPESTVAAEGSSARWGGSAPREASHDVVPPKYRSGTGTAQGRIPTEALARKAAASPSLVRPSRRPPPDPAPKRPEEETPAMAEAPVTTGPLFDRIARASRAWQTIPGTTAAAQAAPARHPLAEPARPAAPLVTDAQLKFTIPHPCARTTAGATRQVDIVKNVLRPAQPAPPAGGRSSPMATDPTVNPLAEGGVTFAATGWTTRRGAAPAPAESPAPPPASGSAASPAAAVAARDAASAPPPAESAAAAPPADPRSLGGSALVTNPFAPPSLERTPAEREVAPQRPSSVSAAMALPQLPVTTPLPTRSPPVERPYLAASLAAAPPVPAEPAVDELLAPLVDADAYRAQMAPQALRRRGPMRTAMHDERPLTAGSWLAAFERLRQRTGAATPPPIPAQAPADSPTRSLRSDGHVPPLPEMPASTLRR